MKEIVDKKYHPNEFHKKLKNKIEIRIDFALHGKMLFVLKWKIINQKRKSIYLLSELSNHYSFCSQQIIGITLIFERLLIFQRFVFFKLILIEWKSKNTFYFVLWIYLIKNYLLTTVKIWLKMKLTSSAFCVTESIFRLT